MTLNYAFELSGLIVESGEITTKLESSMDKLKEVREAKWEDIQKRGKTSIVVYGRYMGNIETPRKETGSE